MNGIRRGMRNSVERNYPSHRPKVVDFFCGAGGLSLGFEQAGFDIVLGVDQDGHHVSTHERNFPYGASHCGSVVDLTGDSIRKLAGTQEIDVVIGGPPCQGFSHMGLRDLNDSRNELVAHYMRLVLELMPKAFLMENVPGLLSGATRKILDDVIELAESNGYVITKPVQVLDASNFGVPQKRRRLFLLGLRNDVEGRIEYPTGICKGQPERPTILEAIGDLPDIEKEDRLLFEGFTKYSKKPKSDYSKVARGQLADPSDLSRPRDWDSETCTGCLRVKHSPTSVDLYNATPPGEIVPGHKLPRLAPDGVAPTLRAGSDSTHGSYTAPRPIHPIQPRCITSREAARLHGFPDWFSFYPLKWHAYRQIGNAVCPPVARALGTSILEALSVKRTRKAPIPLKLEDVFTLPDERPRTLKRIPVMEEFPMVVDHLFMKVFNPKSKKLSKSTFTFEDVKQAIEATGSKLHWTREDTFLQEIARSRAVKRILSSIHSFGYSIRLEKKGGSIGEFVPIGSPGTIEERESVQIRIDEIHNAVNLHIQPVILNGNAEAVQGVLMLSEVRKNVWGNAKMAVIIQGKTGDMSPSKNRTVVYPIEVGKAKKTRTNSALIVCRTATAITKTRISQIAKTHACDDLVAFVSATSKHFVAIRYSDCQTHIKEVSRTAFEMTGEK
jgi:DNA (cytosine-5)-methyltransferase 1